MTAHQSPRQTALRDPQLLFAHRGASAHAPENTLEAFRLAVRLGATGIESDVWLTQDGVPVLDHDGTVGRLRKRPIGEVLRADLPDHIPSLDEMYSAIGALDRPVAISLDVNETEAIEAVISVARSHRCGDQLWICHRDHEVLAAHRDLAGSTKLVHSTALRNLSTSVERHAATLRSTGIDALNLHRGEWTGGHVAMVHRFGRHAFAWDAQHEHHLSDLLHIGVDAVYSDHVDRMVDAAAAAAKPSSTTTSRD